MMLGLPQLPPHLTHLDKRRQYRYDTRRYNDTGQSLDVWKRGQLEGAPVLLWLPGGAWASASRFTMQGHALMAQLVEQGWICLSVDYRTAPWSHWSAQLDDALTAVDWARINAKEYGGDPDFVCIAGASAGGHLATLVGQRGAVDAVASLYGSY
ncbi:MAG TPA: alpha/beta hydrolase, partial [Ktedonobacteraceae bacterium]|nr:alpha/beta hydrolase [Ktedonobacteraceae bacterium]